MPTICAMDTEAPPLWDSNTDSPLSEDAILDKLKDVKEFGPLRAGVVTNVAEQSAQVLLKNGEHITLEWDGLKWARKYITRYRQGLHRKRPPKFSMLANKFGYVRIQMTVIF